jgi:hypothetical protein
MDFRPSAAGTVRDLREGTDLLTENPFFASEASAAHFIASSVDVIRDDLAPDIRYADFGGGQGSLTRSVRDHLLAKGFSVNATVVDSNKRYLQQAAEQGLEAVLANLESCDIPAQQLITMRLVNHYNNVDGQCAILRNAKRALAEHGFLISQIETTTEICCDLWNRVAAMADINFGDSRCHWVSERAYLAMLRDAGFKDISAPSATASFDTPVDLLLNVGWRRSNGVALRDAVAVDSTAEILAEQSRRRRFMREAHALLYSFLLENGNDAAGLRIEGSRILLKTHYPIFICRN